MSDETGTPAEAKAKAPVVSRAVLAKKVQEATGAKMKDVQAIVRATLDEMGKALRAGDKLNVPPFGSARTVNNAGTKDGVLRVIIRDVKENERPAKPERPDRPARAANAAARPQRAAKPRAPRPGAAKQTLAAKGEAE